MYTVYINNFHNSVIEYYRIEYCVSIFHFSSLGAWTRLKHRVRFFLLLLSVYQIFICNIQDVWFSFDEEERKTINESFCFFVFFLFFQ